MILATLLLLLVPSLILFIYLLIKKYKEKAVLGKLLYRYISKKDFIIALIFFILLTLNISVHYEYFSIVHTTESSELIIRILAGSWISLFCIYIVINRLRECEIHEKGVFVKGAIILWENIDEYYNNKYNIRIKTTDGDIILLVVNDYHYNRIIKILDKKLNNIK